MSFFILMSMTSSLIFMCLNHPVSLSIMIFIQTISISMICGLMSNNFWFSYMLFLVMIGGIMVLFLYMTNVASNEKFKPSKLVMLILMLFFILLLTSKIIDKMYFYIQVSSWLNFNNSINTILMKFFNYPSSSIMIIMMIYLLMTLIMTVKITDISKGALRQKF